MRSSFETDSSSSRDYDLSELPEEWWKTIEPGPTSWFASLGYGRRYADAERVWVRFKTDENHPSVCFYRRERFLGIFWRLLLWGPVQAEYRELLALMVLQRAQYATVSLMSEEQASRFAESWYRWKKVHQCEDPVIELPDTLDAYLAGLGRQARKHLPYYARRLQREWGKSFECLYLRGLDITADAFSRLVDLNRMRMARRGSKSLWTPSKVRSRWLLAQETGLLVGLRYHGEMIGGTLSYLHDGEAYLVLIGHQPVYDRLNIGNVCLYQTVAHLIELGVKRFHLLWGQSFYKKQFGGQEKSYFEITAFRTPVLALPFYVGRSIHQALLSLRKWIGRLVSRNAKRAILRLRNQFSSKFDSGIDDLAQDDNGIA